ncbi:MAG: NAD-dependent epimerase/dehydratase family protein, partial [Deltaproteobacteria bacterium]|nr:NAD-dependent epimerase/dehydratase family protein [Kofleriaceae bacterium]
TLRRDVGAVDAVVHLGSPVLRSIEPWSPDARVLHRANVVSVGNLVARFGGPSTTFCFISSSTVYGPPRLLPVREDHPLTPASLYAVHKLLGELWTQQTCALDGTRALVLRLGQVYGPGTPPHIAARAFLERALAGEAITLTVPPTTIRDYVHVDDAAGAVVAALAARATGVFNIAGGEPTTLWQWAHLAVRCAATSAAIVVAPSSPDAPSFWMDLSAARHAFGWSPQITPAEGMARERARIAAAAASLGQ